MAGRLRTRNGAGAATTRRSPAPSLTRIQPCCSARRVPCAMLYSGPIARLGARNAGSAGLTSVRVISVATTRAGIRLQSSCSSRVLSRPSRSAAGGSGRSVGGSASPAVCSASSAACGPWPRVSTSVCPRATKASWRATWRTCASTCVLPGAAPRAISTLPPRAMTILTLSHRVPHSGRRARRAAPAPDCPASRARADVLPARCWG